LRPGRRDEAAGLRRGDRIAHPTAAAVSGDRRRGGNGGSGMKNDTPASRHSVPQTGAAARKRRWRERKRLGLPAWEPPPKGTALGRIIAEPELPLGRLTVLKPNLDPFRLDTPAHHRNGQWFAEQIQRLVPYGSVHLRGLHYRIVAAADVCKPNGKTYVNTEEDWNWLIEFAAKAALARICAVRSDHRRAQR
jgi:hypothetical protein